MYVKIENGNVIQAGLPESGALQDGRMVSGYNLLPDDVLKAEGWLPLEQIIPVYDAETQHIMHDSYTVETDKVVETFTVCETTVPINIEALAEQMVIAQRQLELSQEAIDFLIMGGI